MIGLGGRTKPDQRQVSGEKTDYSKRAVGANLVQAKVRRPKPQRNQRHEVTEGIGRTSNYNVGEIE